MASFKSLVFASTAAAILIPLAATAAPAWRDGLVIAAAEPDAVLAAERAVSDARAELRRAMASGRGLRQARAALTAAEKLLDQAELAAPSPPAVIGPAPGAGGRAANGSPGATVAASAAAPIEPVGVGERAADGRIILREGGRLVVAHDDDARFSAGGARIVDAQAGNGERIMAVDLPDGSQVVTVRDAAGSIVRRTLKLQNGQVAVLVDAKPADGQEIATGGDYLRRLPPVAPNIPAEQYVVEAKQATPQTIEAALAAPPVENVERPYTLAEVRDNARLRDKLRRIDIDSIAFDRDQATIAEGQVAQLDNIGRVIADIIGARPDEVFLIEGHTDAVGTEVANLLVSDRRAEAVADVLTAYYKIPPENLVTQGYGAQYLKVPTQAPEPENRRITVRRITPLLRGVNSE